ncbi:trypsin [Danaus plexippus plexippus]|uniref:Trypsin n=1 Tax=Danaus plexippus plexippus TaxID=278856 RepID=A0A212F7H7_DANPL|nr:chymotrypsin-1-like [Danaus plexippus plexippus]OWR49695.1 trypsin [Danaus plexippus plexippus]
MIFQAGCLLLSLVAGIIGLPLNGEQDTSPYFDSIQRRIYNGDEAGPVPHMVALVVGTHTKTFVCGASLITTRHVLTAAHCIDAVTKNGALIGSLKGIVGTNYWNKGGTHYTFTVNIPHPQWDSIRKRNDIGILVTSLPVTLNKYVQVVSLNFNFIGGNVPVIVHGWGRLQKEAKESSPSLQELRTFTIDSSSCASRILNRQNTTSFDPNREICTFLDKNSGVFFGDSGSPLILQDTRQQIAVVSRVFLGTTSRYPDLYLRVSAYKDWIQQILRL